MTHRSTPGRGDRRTALCRPAPSSRRGPLWDRRPRRRFTLSGDARPDVVVPIWQRHSPHASSRQHSSSGQHSPSQHFPVPPSPQAFSPRTGDHSNRSRPGSQIWQTLSSLTVPAEMSSSSPIEQPQSVHAPSSQHWPCVSNLPPQQTRSSVSLPQARHLPEPSSPGDSCSGRRPGRC